MNKIKQAESMLVMAQEKQPRQQTLRGKIWVDATLQVQRSWLRGAVIAEHKDIMKYSKR